ncbi:hypothetical protein C0989_003319 [Termitomyces sp. Mn162]|nr:hypothetical protein C0989_003319 [Termitomyces sp. Mn162]
MDGPNNCALDANGSLKDARDIRFYNSQRDTHPIGATDDISNVEGLPSPAAIGQKGKSPARHVGGKRIPEPSAKFRTSDGILDRIFSQVSTAAEDLRMRQNLIKVCGPMM